MVNLHLTNKKLVQRGITILEELAKVDRARAAATLEKAGRSVPLALVMLKTGDRQSRVGATPATGQRECSPGD